MTKFKGEAKKIIEKGVRERILMYYPKGTELPENKLPEFEFLELTNPVIENFDIDEPNITYLFFVERLPANCKNPDAAEKAKKELNNKNGKNCMPKINKENWGDVNLTEYGHCLYVGSCRNNKKENKITDRMKAHLGELFSTFGLHLDAWWDKKLPVKVFVFIFGDKISEEYLTLIEEVLWDAYHPLFGKKGPR